MPNIETNSERIDPKMRHTGVRSFPSDGGQRPEARTWKRVRFVRWLFLAAQWALEERVFYRPVSFEKLTTATSKIEVKLVLG